MQIDSFMQLPKDKRPPESIWNKPEEVEEWLDRVYDRDKSTHIDLVVDDIEG